MTDEEAEAVAPAYLDHLSSLDLPGSVQRLARVNAHDAYMLSVSHSAQHGTLQLVMRCGDRQIGYYDVTLDFSKVVIERSDLEMVRATVRPAEFEVLYDEVDRAGEAFEYRLLFNSEHEVSFRFATVAISEAGVDQRL